MRGLAALVWLRSEWRRGRFGFVDGGLALFQGEIIGGEELVEDLNGIVVTGDGLAALIPS